MKSLISTSNYFGIKDLSQSQSYRTSSGECTRWSLYMVAVAVLGVLATAPVVTSEMTSAYHMSNDCAKLETYNVGLMSSVDGVDETYGRVHRIVDALRASKSDFICLQETWMEKYVRAIIEGVEDVFPYHFSHIHEAKSVLRGKSDEGWFGMNDRACTLYESMTVYSGMVTCAVLNGCFNKVSSVSIGACVTNSCQGLMKMSGISDYCVSCVFMNSARDLSEGITQCALPQSAHNRMNGPGLLVLSRQDMKNVSFTNLFPDNHIITQRGYITAELESGIKAVCTHLSPNLDHHGYLEYDTVYESYQSQQVAEIQRVMEKLKDSDAVLLGDMNTGPSVTHSNPEENVDADLPDNFDLLMKEYRSPFLEEDGRCTFCLSNPLVQDSPNALIDHILVKKETSMTVSHAMRLYDDESAPPLSDHYGVGLHVCRNGKRQAEVCQAGSQDCSNN